MANVADLVAQAIAGGGTPGAPVSSMKQDEVIQATAAKKAELGGSLPSAQDLQNLAVQQINPRFANRAVPVHSQAAADLATLSLPQLISKYGSDTAMKMIGGNLDAASNYQGRAITSRGASEAVTDPAVDIGSAFVNGIAGLGVLGLGAADKGIEAVTGQPTGMGSKSAELLQKANDWTQHHLQSAALNVTRQVSGMDNQFTNDSHKLDADNAKARGDKGLMTDLTRVGKDALDAIGNAVSRPQMLESGVANATGSLLSAGPIGRALKVGGEAMIGGERATALLRGAVDHSAMPAAIGLQEGSGAYQQTAAQIQSMDHTTLMQTSPQYRDLVSQGMDPDTAKAKLANDAGLQAGLEQGAVAAATGVLVAPFEEAPFKMRPAGEVGWNMAKEGVEETINSGTGQLAQNLAVKQNVDPNQDVLDQVGEQAGEGGLYGFASAGGPQAPGAIAHEARAAFGSLGSAAANKAAQVQSGIEAQSPVSAQAFDARQADMVAQAPALAAQTTQAVQAQAPTPDVAQQHQTALDTLFSKIGFDPATDAQHDGPAVQQAVASATDKFDALKKVASVAANPETPATDKLDAGAFLLRMEREHGAVYGEHLRNAIDSLGTDNPLKGQMQTFQRQIAEIGQHPEIRKAVTAANEALSNPDLAKSLTEAKVETRQGQRTAQSIADLVTANPDSVTADNVDTVKAVLQHAEDGRVQLTPDQHAALSSAAALVNANQERLAGRSALGLSNSEEVSRQIQNAPGQLSSKSSPLSATAHAKGVIKAAVLARTSGNPDDLSHAKTLMQDLGLFAQHMQNKVAALNGSYADGDTHAETHFQALSPNRQPGEAKWYTTKKSQGQFLRPTSVRSVQNAQATALDARAVASLHNGVAEAFPELAAHSISSTDLTIDPTLAKSAQDIVAEHGKPQETTAEAEVKTRVNPETAAKVEPNQGETAPEPVQTKDVAKVEEGRPYKEITQDELVSYDMHAIDYDHAVSEDDVLKQAAVRITAKDFAEKTDRQDAGLIDPKGRLWIIDSSKVDDTTGNGDHAAFFGLLNASTRNWRASEGYIRVTGYGDQIATSQSTGEPNPKQEATIRALQAQARRTGKNYIGLLQETAKDKPAPVEAKPAQQEEAKTPQEPAQGEEPGKSFVGSSHLAEALPEPVVARSRIHGLGKLVLKTVRSAFTDAKKFTDLAGKVHDHALNDEVAEAYQKYLAKLQPVGKHMLDQLAAGLELFDAGSINTSSLRGKALNLLVEDAKGNLAYDPALLHGAMLAGFQWLLTAGQQRSPMNAEALAKVLGIQEDEVDPDQLKAFNDGASLLDAKSRLADTIRRFWGLKENPNAPDGYVQGIPEAMAAEVLEAMAKADVIDFVQLLQSGEFATPAQIADGKVQKFLQIRVVEDETFRETLQAASEYPQALEDLLLKDPQPVRYVDKPPEEVDQFQLRNRLAETTAQQKKALAVQQKTPFFANMPVVSLYSNIGKDLTVQLFGAGKLDEKTTNVNHLKSLAGVNRTVSGAWEALQSTTREMANVAGVKGAGLHEIPIYFRYGVSTVGRMHMQGSYNPQISKFMREALLSTKSQLDLTDRRVVGDEGKFTDYSRFMLAVAQAIGEKVNKQTRALSVGKAEDLVEGDFKPVVDLLRDHLSGLKTEWTADDIGMIKDTLGDKLSPVAIHALMDYARFTDGSAKDRAAFQTALYLEADGITDGAINALVHFGSGMFSPKWLRQVAKGGLYFSKDSSANGYYAEGATDLYGDATSLLTRLLGQQRDGFQELGHDALLAQHDGLLKVMDAFGMNLKIVNDEDGQPQLEIGRGAVKNPLTISIYGSGPKGIAGKIVRELTDAFYEMQTQLARGETPFAEDRTPEEAQAKFDEIMHAMGSLMERVAAVDEDGEPTGELVSPATQGERFGDDPAKLTLSKDQIDHLKKNMLDFYVLPMQAAIQQTVLGEVSHVTDLVQKSTQVMSIVGRRAFQLAYEKAIEAKAKADPTWQRHEGLSQKELQAVEKSIGHLGAWIRTGTQTLFVGGSDTSLKEKSQRSRALDDRLGTPVYIAGPDLASVKGKPYLTIGTGDAQVTQNVFTGAHVPKGGFGVFDGFHTGLDNLEEDHQAINQAVHQGWMANPFAAVDKAYGDFLKNVRFQDMNQNDWYLLGRAVLENEELRGVKADKVSPRMQSIIQGRVQALQAEIADTALEVQARHNVMAEVEMSVDHMAGAGSPYQAKGEGKISLDGLSESLVLNILNELFTQELDKLRGEVPSENISEDLKTLAEPDANRVRVVGVDALAKLAPKLKIPAEHKSLLLQMTKTLAESGYQVVMGARDALLAHANATGKTLSQENVRNANGLIVPDDRSIYLIAGSSETLAHELVHAATYEKVDAYYSNPQSLHPEERDAVQRLDALMDEWRGLGKHMSEQDPAAYKAYSTALRTVNSVLKTSRAQAVNEFMAWNLANQDLIRVLGRTEVKNPMARVINNTLRLLKQMLWGRQGSQHVASDFLSNLRFNTEVLTRTPVPTLQSRLAEVVMAHGPIFGSDERLQGLIDNFQKKIAIHLASEPRVPGNLTAKETVAAKTVAKDDRQSAVEAAIKGAGEIARVFMSDGMWRMTPQEQTAFELMVSAFATEAHLDPNAVAKVQELYAHVSKTLDPDDFRVDSTSLDPADEYQAQQKYKALMGRLKLLKDEQGRTSLLPAFLALAATNDEFRLVLHKMEMPAKAPKTWKNLDGVLANLAGSSLDNLSSWVSGEQRNSPNVLAAIDALTTKVADVTQDRRDLLAQISNPVAGALNQVNDKLVGMINDGADRAYVKLTDAQAKTSNKIAQTALGLTAAFVGIANEKRSAQIAEGVLAAINTHEKVPEFLRSIANDLIGRTESNAGVYDEIKPVRTEVSQTRQNFRETVPKVIAHEFKSHLDEHQWTHLFKGMAKTDLAALRQSLSIKQIIDLATDKKKASAYAQKLEAEIRTLDPKRANRLLTKAEELAHYMSTGEVKSPVLLRNAFMVARLAGEPSAMNPNTNPDKALVRAIDQWVSLKALESQSEQTHGVLSSLVQTDRQGLEFAMAYLEGQRNDEQKKITGLNSQQALANHYKGYAPTEAQRGAQLLVASDHDFAKLIQQGFKRVADYQGSSAEPGLERRGYYYNPVSGRAPFAQGMLQNVHETAGGVDPATGFSYGPMTAGRVTEPTLVKQIKSLANANSATLEHLMPVFDTNYRVVAYERAVDPSQLKRLHSNEQLHQVLGQWRGRQVEEERAVRLNEQVIGKLAKMWEKAKLDKTTDQYVNLFDPKALKDPVVRDAMKLITPRALEAIRDAFGEDGFQVRRELLQDVIGSRQATVGDAWTGVSRWDPKVQNTVRNLATMAFGKNAFRVLTTTEKTVQGFMTDARLTIVVRSMVVPMSNFISGIYQLLQRGVSLSTIARLPKKIAEVRTYDANRRQMVKLEAQLRAASGDIKMTQRLGTQIRALKDANSRLSIAPLIKAGEFSAISEVGAISHEEHPSLLNGDLMEFIEHKIVETLGKVGLQDLGRYAFVAKDTALFQGMTAAMNYGDFLMKAVLFDHLTEARGKTNDEALAQITEEFVNYDRLVGRSRAYLESMGLLWFYNFKLRSTKVALSILRNNPLHALLSSFVPAPTMFGSVGTPLNSNLISMAANGNLHYSIGMNMGFHSHDLLPVHQLLK